MTSLLFVAGLLLQDPAITTCRSGQDVWCYYSATATPVLTVSPKADQDACRALTETVKIVAEDEIATLTDETLRTIVDVVDWGPGVPDADLLVAEATDCPYKRVKQSAWVNEGWMKASCFTDAVLEAAATAVPVPYDGTSYSGLEVLANDRWQSLYQPTIVAVEKPEMTVCLPIEGTIVCKRAGDWR